MPAVNKNIPTSDWWSYATPNSGITDTVPVAAKASAGTTERNYITSAVLSNGHATVGTEMVIASSTTVLFRAWIAPAGGNISVNFDPPLQGGQDEDINIANVTTGSQTYFSLQGFAHHSSA